MVQVYQHAKRCGKTAMVMDAAIANAKSGANVVLVTLSRHHAKYMCDILAARKYDGQNITIKVLGE